MQETQVPSLGGEGPLEKEMATHYSILGWRICMVCLALGLVGSCMVLGFSVGASLVAQRLKCLTAMWETWVRSLGQEDPLEKEMATHSNILAWKILWTEEFVVIQSMGSLELDT